MKNNKKQCDLCGYRNTSLFIEAKGLDLARNILFRLVKCNSCGLIYLDEDLSPEELKSLDFKEYHGNTNSFYSVVLNFVMNIFMLQRARKIEKVRGGGSILDVGCGNGMFLKKMYTRDWSCYGIDISPYAAKMTEGGNGINAFCGEINDAKLPKCFFDVITFWHSFEHISQPSCVLQGIRSLLKDDGVIFISAPNVNSFEARMNLNKWFGLDLPRHAYHYSPETLRAMLEKNDFKIVALSKNSFEYNFPFFVQTFFNSIGGEFNFLYNFLKRDKYAGRSFTLSGLYTIFLMVVLSPLVLLGTIVIYVVNIICGNGPVIEIFARKRQQ